MQDGRPIRVVIIDDHQPARSRLSALVHAHRQLRLVGEAEDGEDALQLCQMLEPDVALLAVGGQQLDGAAILSAIRQRWPYMRVFILGLNQADERLQRALQAGASGYLDESAGAEELDAAILSAFGIAAVPEKPKAASVQTARAELEWAGRVQAGMLPDKPPSLPGWEIAARLEPARETSGDFYDFIPLPNNKLGIVIADVTDKGLGAAVFMALASSLIRTYASRYPTLPALALSSVNERILSDTRGSIFVTAFYAVLEPEIGRLRYVNAGHGPPMLLSSLKGKPVDRLGRTGIPLGVMDSAVWGQKIARLSPGDLLLLYTDGVTEAQDRYGDFFGEARLMDALRLSRAGRAGEVLESVAGALNRFTGDTPRQDDRALVVLTRK
jgi:sigma-B regulation protein RsbU (phosphoserine phosphatase)